MSTRRALTVKYSPHKSNFVILPETYFKLASTYPNACLVLNHRSGTYYVSWAPYSQSSYGCKDHRDNEIGISAVTANALGLREGDDVSCSIATDVKSLRSVNVSPVSKKDWEVLKLSPLRIQSQMLDQIRIVNRGQIVVAWLSRSIFVQLRVDNLTPSMSYGRLENNTELIVDPVIGGSGSASLYKSPPQITKSPTTSEAPLVRRKSIRDRQYTPLEKSYSVIEDDLDRSSVSPRRSNKEEEFEGLLNGLKKSVTMADVRLRKLEDGIRGNKPLESEEEDWDDIMDAIKKELPQYLEFRVVPGKWEDETQFSDVFVTKANVGDDFNANQIYSLKTAAEKEYFVQVKIVRRGAHPTTTPPILEVNEHLMKLLEMTPHERIQLKPKPMLLNRVDKIELIPSKAPEAGRRDLNKIEHMFKSIVLESSKDFPVLLNQDQILRLENYVVTVRLWPFSLKVAAVDLSILRESKIEVSDEVKSVSAVMERKEASADPEVKRKGPRVELDKFKKLVDECVDRLARSLCLRDSTGVRLMDNLMIVGPPNSGKTSLVNEISAVLKATPYNCFIYKFSCVKNKGRKPESIQKDLKQAFKQCLLHAPAILVLDTLDYLTHAEGEQHSQDSDYYNKVSDLVRETVEEFTRATPISVIATVCSQESLNRRIFPRKGFHLFHRTIAVPSLDKADREHFIKQACLSIKDRKLIDWSRYASLTDGYKVGDLAFLMERAIYYAYKHDARAPTLTDECLRQALSVTNEIFLQGIESHSQVELDEVDIAGDEIPGLERAVEVFEEVIRWPAEFPPLFEAAPVKLPKGILLYGPPGVGKTFFVRQIAKTWSLRMISVKGPELLAKFIGQSEENVRTLFKRAQAARPCILFFDEFDSLAPRRGHDSTGVTDRVVNQLLTLLDGVEELHGVIVVAATSRPELLDPAILRPGRIERHVEVELPNQKARLKILRALSQTLRLDEGVDFKPFADRMKGWSGADIMSFLTTANMDAVQQQLAEDDENVPEFVVIKKQHLERAFAQTKPSIKPADLERYRRTYAQFGKSEPPSLDFVGKKATLA